MKLAGKKDIIVIAAALILCVAAALIFRAPAGGSIVRVRVDGEVYCEAPLNEDKTIVVEQQNGARNEICISNGSVYMHSASCPNKECVEQGEMSEQNAASRALGNWIICLPNRVTVELITEDDK